MLLPEPTVPSQEATLLSHLHPRHVRNCLKLSAQQCEGSLELALSWDPLASSQQVMATAQGADREAPRAMRQGVWTLPQLTCNQLCIGDDGKADGNRTGV